MEQIVTANAFQMAATELLNMQFSIKSIKTTSMENVSTGVFKK